MATVADLWESEAPAKSGGASTMPAKKSFSTYKDGIVINEPQQAEGKTVADLWETTPQQTSTQTAKQPQTSFVTDALNKALQLRQQMPGFAASALDVVANAPSALAQTIGYGAGRAFGLSPEEAARSAGKLSSQLAVPVGRLTGTAQTPEYQKALPTQAMEKLGQVVQERVVQPIAQRTGASPLDVEQGVNAAMMALPFGVKPVARGIAEAKAALPTVRIERVPGGPQSGGAAAVTTPSMVEAALTQVSPELRESVKGIPVNQVNMPVLQRHIEADTLPVPVRLTEGQATGDPVIISKEMNSRGKPGSEALVGRLNEQNGQLISNLEAIREKVGPDVYGTKPIENAQTIIDSYKDLNQKLETDINGKYQALRDAAGGQFPVDAPKLLENVQSRLKKDLLSNDAPPSQFKELQRLANENSMTFEDYLSLRRNLGDVARTSTDGNIRRAASLMIDELEKLPLQKDAAGLKPLADEARSAARSRFQMLEKDPAFKAAVDDSVPADKYIQKFVVNGINKNVAQMVQNLGEKSPAHQSMGAGALYHLKEKAGVIDDRGNFSQAGYNKALRNLEQMNNLNLIFDGESAQNLKSLGNVAAYIQNQPKGSFVNNSNTLVGALAERASALTGLAAEKGLNMAAPGLQLGTTVMEMRARRAAAKEAQKSLSPAAGVQLKDIGKE